MVVAVPRLLRITGVEEAEARTGPEAAAGAMATTVVAPGLTSGTGAAKDTARGGSAASACGLACWGAAAAIASMAVAGAGRGRS